jgi:hypothetical protein
MRVYHRYLGYFLAGIMTVYSLSGIVLIFRDTDFLKKENKIEKTLKPHLKIDELGKELKMRDLKADKEDSTTISFKQGVYNKETGIANYTVKQLPRTIEKLTKLHKANTKDPLFYLNIFFGVSLFFFVLSSFWMFLPKSSIFKKGLYFTLAGIVLTIILLMV